MQLLGNSKHKAHASLDKKRKQWFESVLKIYEEMLQKENSALGNVPENHFQQNGFLGASFQQANQAPPIHEYLRQKRHQNNQRFKEILQHEKEKIARLILNEINAKRHNGQGDEQRAANHSLLHNGVAQRSMDSSRIGDSITKKSRSAMKIRERHQNILREKQERLQRKRREMEVRNERIKRRKENEVEKKRMQMEEKHNKKAKHIQNLQRVKDQEMREKHERHLMKAEENLLEAERISRQKQYKRDQIEHVRRIKEEKVRKFLEEKEQYEKEAKMMMSERKKQRLLLRQALERIQKSPNEAPPSWVSSDIERMKTDTHQNEENGDAMPKSTPMVYLEASTTAALDHRIRSARHQKLSPLRRESINTDSAMSTASVSDVPRTRTSLGFFESQRNKKKLLRFSQEKADKILSLPYWDSRPVEVIKKRKLLLQQQAEHAAGEADGEHVAESVPHENGTVPEKKVVAHQKQITSARKEPTHDEASQKEQDDDNAPSMDADFDLEKDAQVVKDDNNTNHQVPTVNDNDSFDFGDNDDLDLSPTDEKSSENAVNGTDENNFDENDSFDLDGDVKEKNESARDEHADLSEEVDQQEGKYEDDASQEEPLQADDSNSEPLSEKAVERDSTEEQESRETALEMEKPASPKKDEDSFDMDNESFDFEMDTREETTQKSTEFVHEQPAANVEEISTAPQGESPAAPETTAKGDSYSDFMDDDLDFDMDDAPKESSKKPADGSATFDAELDAMMNDFEGDDTDDKDEQLSIDDDIDEWLNL